MLALAPFSPATCRAIGAALDRAADPVAVFEVNGPCLVLTDGNAAFARLTGWTQAEAQGRDLATLLDLPESGPQRGQLAAALAGDGAAPSEVACRSRQGRAFWLEFRLLHAGPAVVLLGRDVSHSRATAQQQHAVQALLAKMFQVIDAAVAIVDDNGIVLMANPGLHALLGQPPGTLGSTRLIDHMTPASGAEMAEARGRQKQDGAPFTLAAAMLRPGGPPIAVRLTAVQVVRADLQRFHICTLLPTPEPPRFTVAGKLQLVGLAQVRATLGPRWPELASRAFETAEHVLRRRLGPTDSFSRTEDDGFMLCFGGLTETEAAFRAAMIGREIRQRLIGLEHGTAALAATTGRVTSIAAVLETPEAADPVTLDRLLEERLAARRTEIEARARETLRDAMHSAACMLDDVTRRDGAAIAHFARLDQAAEHRIVAASAALPADEASAFDIDTLRLRLAGERAALSAAEGTSLPLLVEIGFGLFEGRGRARRVAEACLALPEALRDQLTLVLTDCPDDVPDARLRDCLQRLRPYCREVAFQLPALALPPAAAGPGPALLVIEAADLLAGGVLRDEALFQFMPELHGRGGRLLVRDVLTQGLARDLREIGVDMIAMRSRPV